MAKRAKFTYSKKSKMAAAAILNFEKFQYLLIGYRVFLQIWWPVRHGHYYGDDRRYSDNIINYNCKMAFSLHCTRSPYRDEYNF